MTTHIVAIDESSGVQQNDTALGLPTELDDLLETLLGTSYPTTIVEKAFSTALAFDPSTPNLQDVALTDTNGNALAGTASNLIAISGAPIYLYSDSGNNNLVLGRVGMEGSSGYEADPDGSIAFAIYLDAATGKVWVVEFTALQHYLNTSSSDPRFNDPNDFVSLTGLLGVTVSTPIAFDATGAPSGANLFITYGDGTYVPSEVAAVVTAPDAANQSAGFNVSSGGVVKTSQAGTNLGGATFGKNSQMLDPPNGNAAESLYWTFVTGANPDLVVNAAKELSPTEANIESNIQFTSFFGAERVSFIVSQLQQAKMATLQISAWNQRLNDKGTADTSDDAPWTGVDYVDNLDKQDAVAVEAVTITRVVATRNSSTTYEWTFTENQTTGAVTLVTKVNGTVSELNAHQPSAFNVSADFSNDTAVLRGVIAGDKLIYDTVGTHNRLQITNAGDSEKQFNAAFDIGRLLIESGGTTTTPLADIRFYDDGPVVIGTVSKRVEEDELSTTAPAPSDLSDGITDADAFTDEVTFSNAELQAVVAPGADTPLEFNLNPSVSGAVKDIDGNDMYSKGQAINWSFSGGVVSAVADGRTVFTITQTAGADTLDPSDDVFTVDLRDQIDHPDASGDGGIETLDLTPAFTAIDFDRDPVDLNGPGNDLRPIRLVVENDVPALSGNTVSKRVEEDELSTSAPAPADLSNGITDADAFTDEVTFSYADLQAVVTPGADEPQIFNLNLDVSGAVRNTNGEQVYSKGEAITWSVNGGVVSAVANLRTVFTITKTTGADTPDPSDDVFTVDLRDQIDHPSASGDDGIVTLDLTPAFTATDFDKDPADLNGPSDDQRPIRLVVENDIPVISAQIISGMVEFATDATGKVTSSLNGLIGADETSATSTSMTGVKQYTFASLPTAPTNVIPGLTASWGSTDHTQIVFSVTSGGVTTDYYRITLDQTANSGAGSYLFEVLQPQPVSETQFGFADQPAGQNLFGIIASNKGNLAGTPPNATLPDGGLLFFNKGVVLDANGAYVSNTSSTVNTSKGGGEVSIGYGANNYSAAGQDAFFIFVDNPTYNAVGGLGLTQTTADDADTIKFDGTNEVTIASVEIVKIVGGSEAGVTIKPFNLDPNNTGLLNIDTDAEARSLVSNPLTFGGVANDADQVSINGVRVYSSNTTLNASTLVFSAKDLNNDGDFADTGELLINTNNVTVVLNAADRSLTVTGMDTDKNYTVQYDTQTPHDMAQVLYVAGSYNLGGFNLIEQHPVADQLFNFSIQVTDFDNDTNNAALNTFEDFSVVVNGSGPFAMNDISTDDLDTAKADATVTRKVVGYTPNTDKLDYFIAATAGIGSNYTEVVAPTSPYDTFSAYKDAADAALDGSVLYFFGVVGSNGYLSYDFDGQGFTSIIELAGVTDISPTDII